MKMLKYLAKRILIFIPLFVGVVFVAFYLVRLLPGDPAHILAGSYAFEDTIEALTKQMGLDKPVFTQFLIYMKGVLHGDLGYSWFTSSSVTQDILTRFPATFELITLSILMALVIGMAIGIGSAVNPKGIFSKISSIYGLLAGSFADFWLALLFIYLFFAVLGIAPAPMGRLNIILSPPKRITGMYVFDSLVTGNWVVFKDALAHLALPVITIGLIQGAAVMKMTNSTMVEIMESDFIHHAKIMGLPTSMIVRYALRNSLSAIVATVGNIYTFLLGGAVLIETVFSLGGLGQYVTQALSNKDYQAIQGFILVATVFSMVLYLVIDIIQMIIDPRIKY